MPTRLTPRTFALGELTVIVLERDHTDAHAVGRRLWFQGHKDFTAVLVRGPHGTSAFDAHGLERPLEDLLAEHPQLAPLA